MALDDGADVEVGVEAYHDGVIGRGADMELGHWVTGSMGHLGHLSRPGHRVTGSSF